MPYLFEGLERIINSGMGEGAQETISDSQKLRQALEEAKEILAKEKGTYEIKTLNDVNEYSNKFSEVIKEMFNREVKNVTSCNITESLLNAPEDIYLGLMKSSQTIDSIIEKFNLIEEQDEITEDDMSNPYAYLLKKLDEGKKEEEDKIADERREKLKKTAVNADCDGKGDCTDKKAVTEDFMDNAVNTLADEGVVEEPQVVLSDIAEQNTDADNSDDAEGNNAEDNNDNADEDRATVESIQKRITEMYADKLTEEDLKVLAEFVAEECKNKHVNHEVHSNETFESFIKESLDKKVVLIESKRAAKKATLNEDVDDALNGDVTNDEPVDNAPVNNVVDDEPNDEEVDTIKLEFPNGDIMFAAVFGNNILVGRENNLKVQHDYTFPIDTEISIDENIGNIYNTLVNREPGLTDETDGASVADEPDAEPVDDGVTEDLDEVDIHDRNVTADNDGSLQRKNWIEASNAKYTVPKKGRMTRRTLKNGQVEVKDASEDPYSKGVLRLMHALDLSDEDLISMSKKRINKNKDFQNVADEDLTREAMSMLNNSVTEGTVKQDGEWVNKGEEGTHGKFKTKKEADAQRKAMFARGFKK